MKQIKKLIKNIFVIFIVVIIVGTILYIKDEKSVPGTSGVNYPNSNEKIYAVGLPIGMHLKTNGVMVINTNIIETKSGMKVNPSKDKIKAGDYITKINEEEINNKKQMIYWINQCKGNEIKVEINRNNSKLVQYIKPIKGKDDKYYIGVWARDDTQGIGTMTFITSNNMFGALGHGISDADTGKILDSTSGNIYNAKIWGVKKGYGNEPGGLCGYIDYSKNNIIGIIYENSECGLYGVAYKSLINKYKLEKYAIGKSDDVKIGKAQIQFITNNKMNKYDIEIIAINKTRKSKNIVIQISDKRLLKMTNGIVQGMSGCPIIQDNKIIGAVTHVLVNNPTKGYGIFIETMLNEIK